MGWAVGDAVMASYGTTVLFNGDERPEGAEYAVYPAVVIRVHTEEGLYDVEFEDGDVEKRVAAAALFPLAASTQPVPATEPFGHEPVVVSLAEHADLLAAEYAEAEGSVGYEEEGSADEQAEPGPGSGGQAPE